MERGDEDTPQHLMQFTKRAEIPIPSSPAPRPAPDADGCSGTAPAPQPALAVPSPQSPPHAQGLPGAGL